ncbi:MAG: AMIN domain-containing protein [Candidatus Dadabacteria bacterium]|nr:MAG: AMIN domain-containing protein [Candidatus Dadabacteria bacterium]
MTEERRQHPRIPVRTIVKMQFATIGEFLQSYAQNISEGGMQLAVAQELQEGDRVGLEFKLKSDYPLIEGTAVVRWCRPSGNHFLVGVAFEELDERSRHTISEALSLKDKTGSAEDLPEDDAETIDVVEDLLSPPDEIEEVIPDEAGFSTDIDGDLIDELSPPADTADETVEAIDADEISIEEVSIDAPPQAASSVDVPDLESLELPEAADDGGFEIEEVDLPGAPAETEDVADLFDDTEVTPEQLEFGTGFDATATTAESDETIAAAEATSSSAGGRNKRLILIVAALLAVGGAGFWWLSRSAPQAPEVAHQPALPDVAPAPVPPKVPAAMPATAVSGTSEGPGAVAAAEASGTGAGTPAAPQHKAPAATPEPRRAPEAAPTQEPEPEPEPEPAPQMADEPARRVVTMLRGSGRDWLVIETDGAVEGHYRYFGLSKPPRAVVDLIGLQRSPGVRAPSFEDHPQVQRVRVGVHPDKIRLVFDLRQDSGFTVVPDGHRLIVRGR